MEVSNFDDTLTQETMAFVDKIKTKYEDKLAEKDAKIAEKEEEIAKLKEELEERKERCCPVGYEKDADIMVVQTSTEDPIYIKYKGKYTEDWDKMLAIVRRDKRSKEIFFKDNKLKDDYTPLYSKKGLPVTKTLFNYIADNLKNIFPAGKYTCYYNRIFCKEDKFEEMVEEIKKLIDNFQDKQ